MKKKMPFFAKILFSITILIMLIIIIISNIQQNKLQNEKNTLSVLVEQYKLRVDELNSDLALPREDYIEKYAREVLGYHKEGELIFK